MPGMIEALVLGIVQGLTEFLPVSSTAHLILMPRLFGWGGLVDTLTFDVALHAGTLLALLVCFWRDWIVMLTERRKVLAFIIVGSVPAGIAGVLLNDIAETHLRSPVIISIALVTVGIVMLAAERGMKDRGSADMTFTDAIIIGCAQAIALIPGVSRSGITISAGLFRHLGREDAARFSFLLSTPIIAGAAALHAPKMIAAGAIDQPGLFATGFCASAATGFAAIKFLLSYFRRHPMHIFIYYRFGLAAAIVLLLWPGI